VSAEAKVLRVLLVEDREDDALLVVRLLQREGYAVRWRRVDGRDALREALEGEPWDVVLCDFRMPGFDAYGALEVVRAHDPDMPFVVVSGTVEEDVIVEMLRAGAGTSRTATTSGGTVGATRAA
jgi:CheY-like chemotaxis protein